ncbi:MAG: LPS assembly lipoprotein LptE [Bacteroidales bacterium]|nr:LPS assembly lipoprotein LptE [Bacteroidales bacterium]MCQ2322243.1 LPS assembly lipoprotein LptE [Bacteroidales bacterium]
MKKIHTLLILIIAFLLTGCGVYSFTGASIPAEAKTVSVAYFPNNANLVQPMLSSVMTNTLRDYFMNQTSLAEVENNGDLAIEGEITGYSTSPTAITGDQTAALNRLTITVNVRFFNKYDESKNFEQKFSQYEDYSSTLDLNAVQDQLMETIAEKLCEDIFNKAVVNW